MNSENAFKNLAGKQLDSSSEVSIESNIYGHGYFVVIDGKSAIVDQEFDGIARLPSFVIDYKTFLEFNKEMERAHSHGKREGKQELKNELGNLLGFAKKDYVEHIYERLGNQIDNTNK